MALPNPLPDNPLRWDGWRKYNSPNLYERLCLDYSSNATNDIIEENCRQLLVWWQKKLPLKNQPSNPMAQVLRQGLDDAPQFLAEARTKLIDPVERARIDAELQTEVISGALDEFKKLLSFTLVDEKLSGESEEKLIIAARRLGLRDEDVKPVIDAEVARTGSIRTIVAPTPPPAPAATHAPVPAATPGDPFSEFRKILRMSRLAIDGDGMTDDQRDAMCNLGESLGLTGGQAEDLIDEYLDEMAGMPPTPITAPPRPTAPAKPAATTPAPPPKPSDPPSGTVRISREVNLSPAARMSERRNYPNFTTGTGIEMYLIPTGRFQMGSSAPDAQPNEQPVTNVTLSCFYIARYPVTNDLYEKFDPAHRSKRTPWADGTHPVVFVSWADAQNFCRWLSQRENRRFRLPSEPEWEYAAHGEDPRIFPWGERLVSGAVANFADARSNFVWRDTSIDDGFAETAPVGTYPRGASPFGIEDMAGNVFEWCLDSPDPYRGKDLVNPRPSTTGTQRIYRGGSWKSRASSLRTTARQANNMNYFANDVGFRLVCECD